METLESFRLILEAGSVPLYRTAVVAAMAVGALLVWADSRAWPLARAARAKLLTVVAGGALVGCALPAFGAGGLIGRIAAEEIVTPKSVIAGLLGGFAGAALMKRAMGLAHDTSDAFARGAAAMMATGRLGCVARHCCFGRPAAWGVDLGDGVARVPVQALEAAFLLGLLALLWTAHRRSWWEHRRLFVLFALYGAGRFGLEFARAQVSEPGAYQAWAALLTSVGLYQLVIRTRLHRRGRTTFMAGAGA